MSRNQLKRLVIILFPIYLIGAIAFYRFEYDSRKPNQYRCDTLIDTLSSVPNPKIQCYPLRKDYIISPTDKRYCRKSINVYWDLFDLSKTLGHRIENLFEHRCGLDIKFESDVDKEDRIKAIENLSDILNSGEKDIIEERRGHSVEAVISTLKYLLVYPLLLLAILWLLKLAYFWVKSAEGE